MLKNNSLISSIYIKSCCGDSHKSGGPTSLDGENHWGDGRTLERRLRRESPRLKPLALRIPKACRIMARRMCKVYNKGVRKGSTSMACWLGDVGYVTWLLQH